jgi:hypothetical protein
LRLSELARRHDNKDGVFVKTGTELRPKAAVKSNKGAIFNRSPDFGVSGHMKISEIFRFSEVFYTVRFTNFSTGKLQCDHQLESNFCYKFETVLRGQYKDQLVRFTQFNPLNPYTNTNIYNHISHLTENTRRHYKDRSVNDVEEIMAVHCADFNENHKHAQ